MGSMEAVTITRKYRQGMADGRRASRLAKIASGSDGVENFPTWKGS